MLAEHIDEAFAHIAIDAALYGIINGWHSFLDFEKNIEKPFRVGLKVMPVRNEHVVAYGRVALVHGLFKGSNILWTALLDDLT